MDAVDDVVAFRMICPGSYKGLPHKLLIKDGKINKKYKELCDEPVHYPNIAYNNDPPWFDVDEATGVFTEYPLHVIAGDFSSIPRDYEIMISFIKFYNIIPNWINCNFTWGWFNEETNSWTGAVGKVFINFFLYNIIFEIFLSLSQFYNKNYRIPKGKLISYILVR